MTFANDVAIKMVLQDDPSLSQGGRRMVGKDSTSGPYFMVKSREVSYGIDECLGVDTN